MHRICSLYLPFLCISSLAVVSAWPCITLCAKCRKNRLQASSSNVDEFSPTAIKGFPSSPGWKRGQLDNLTNWATAEESNVPIICEYEPDGWWLWTKWKGTVLSLTLTPVLLTVLVGVGVDVCVHYYSEDSWPLLAKPPIDNPIIQQLLGLNALWGYQVTLCTFILTFFTSEAYQHWKTVYFTTRRIQGRLNDVSMLVTMSAKENDLVETITRLLRLSHTFFWAATSTCSNGIGGRYFEEKEHDQQLPLEERLEHNQRSAIGPLLLSREGLDGLVKAEAITSEEAQALLTSGLPPSQYTYILLEWVGLYIFEGLELGLLGHSKANLNDSNDRKSNIETLIMTSSSNGLEENLLRQLSALRAEYFNIGDCAAGRMPLAYVQLVQVLVDSLVILAPFSLYSEMGSLSIPLTGLLTLFFKGLLELSKSFLDPFGNEGYPGQNIRVDVLVSELNFGVASRWSRAADAFPKARDV
mmetsp:Transcript_965/g.1487  ORF Transcript_965/g.1487 Transcript_965/m.1487 type:complete len:470 (-) Transcript_965:270-1679(-)|eukprot:CAMPEP_0194229272 /NCGR_PEP_ID=MMETSP0156-20130528/43807_1 /TAXON_ID=33649 /ORGANISM="Thalassionema nitzschioides, Strain L26-B" /LENGTH=469 /DNA_ID=CAMNT_0038961819 /DNA_START=20 /DNA_END=1429 /DNA_ORIENTATION=+